MEVEYGLALRVEFVPAGCRSWYDELGEGDPRNVPPRHPLVDLYFKILPKGHCSLEGGLIGYPVLESVLGFKQGETLHWFKSIGVSLPRGELDHWLCHN